MDQAAWPDHTAGAASVVIALARQTGGRRRGLVTKNLADALIWLDICDLVRRLRAAPWSPA